MADSNPETGLSLERMRDLSLGFISITIILTFISGFVYFAAVPAYLRSVEALLTGQPLYGELSTVYPPFWYGILATIFGPLEILGVNFSGTNYLSTILVKLPLLLSIVLTVYIGLQRNGIDKRFCYWILLNPVILITTVIIGQAEAIIGLGIVAALHGWKTDQWKLVGAGFALGAAMKFYPMLLFASALFKNPRKTVQM